MTLTIKPQKDQVIDNNKGIKMKEREIFERGDIKIIFEGGLQNYFLLLISDMSTVLLWDTHTSSKILHNIVLMLSWL